MRRKIFRIASVFELETPRSQRSVSAKNYPPSQEKKEQIRATIVPFLKKHPGISFRADYLDDKFGFSPLWLALTFQNPKFNVLYGENPSDPDDTGYLSNISYRYYFYKKYKEKED